jgi:hypothetical protein
MSMKVSELKGAWLDYWVARSQGAGAAELEIRPVPRTDDFMCVWTPEVMAPQAMRYTIDWDMCGRILDKYRVTIDHDGFIGPVMCSIFNAKNAQWWSVEGDNAREAVCRAVVMLHFGDSVVDVEAKQ